MQWPSPPHVGCKRQRSPLLDVPLSDPDIDGERGQAQKRYLSEIMASGLSLHMCLEEDMDKGPGYGPSSDTSNGPKLLLNMGTLPSPQLSFLGGTPVGGLMFPSLQAAAAAAASSGQAPAPTPLPDVSQLIAFSAWPPSRTLSPPPGPSPARGTGGGTHAAFATPPQPQPEPSAMLFTARCRPEFRSSPLISPRGDRMRSPDQSPASPTDGRFPLDLRKTALLRSLLMRTDEGMSSGTAPAAGMADVVVPDDTGMAWQVPLPSPQELLTGQTSSGRAGAPGVPAACSSPAVSALGGHPSSAGGSGRPPPVPRLAISGMPASGAQPGAQGSDNLTRAGSGTLPTVTGTSRSESLIEDTANSMDTSSTTGSSALDEEQSRRMSIQGASNLGLDGAVAAVLGGGLGGGGGMPSRHRRSSGGGWSADGRATPRARLLSTTAAVVTAGRVADAAAGAASGMPPAPLFAPGRPVATSGAPTPPGLEAAGEVGEAHYRIQTSPVAGLAQGPGRGLFVQVPNETRLELCPPVPLLKPAAAPSPANLPAGTQPLAPTPSTATHPALVPGTAGLPPHGNGSPTMPPPAVTPSPRSSPTFDEQRLQQLRARAAAESAKLVGELEGLGQYRSIAPQRVLCTASNTALRQPLAQGGSAGGILHHTRVSLTSGGGAQGLGFGGSGCGPVKLPGRKYSSDEGSGQHAGCDLAPFRL